MVEPEGLENETGQKSKAASNLGIQKIRCLIFSAIMPESRPNRLWRCCASSAGSAPLPPDQAAVDDCLRLLRQRNPFRRPTLYQISLHRGFLIRH